jgi:glycosyltransferase involved in cell wall biosynthesis
MVCARQTANDSVRKLMHPRVSVIIPTHNRIRSLESAVNSVLSQTFQDFELIIVDDASSDDTNNYLQKLAVADARITFISNTEPQGGSQSRNLGIYSSHGEWLAFLDDDDVWLPEKLEKQLNALAAVPESVACSTDYRVNFPLMIKKIVNTPSAVTMQTLLKANVLGGASVCICRADLLKSIGGFDGKLKSAQDWDVWVRLREIGVIISVPEVLVEYFVHFNRRISNDMRAKYAGARRFYFKYRYAMSSAGRLANIAFLCYIKSRQSKRAIFARMRYLALAMRNSPLRVAKSYCLSSLPRIFLSIRF